MQVVNLLPLSRAEIGEKKPTFLQKAMAGKVAKTTEYLIGDDLVDAVFTGGYPEMIQRRDRQRRRAWARGYVNAIVQRDVRDIAEDVYKRQGYTCSWCTQSGEELILLPHPLSPAPLRVLPAEETDIVGQVIGVAMRLGGSRKGEDDAEGHENRY